MLKKSNQDRPSHPQEKLNVAHQRPLKPMEKHIFLFSSKNLEAKCQELASSWMLETYALAMSKIDLNQPPSLRKEKKHRPPQRNTWQSPNHLPTFGFLGFYHFKHTKLPKDLPDVLNLLAAEGAGSTKKRTQGILCFSKRLNHASADGRFSTNGRKTTLFVFFIGKNWKNHRVCFMEIDGNILVYGGFPGKERGKEQRFSWVKPRFPGVVLVFFPWDGKNKSLRENQRDPKNGDCATWFSLKIPTNIWFVYKNKSFSILQG